MERELEDAGGTTAASAAVPSVTLDLSVPGVFAPPTVDDGPPAPPPAAEVPDTVEDLRRQFLDHPSSVLAVAVAEAELPRPGPRPPAWLGDDGEAELAASRVLLDADLAERFAALWADYEDATAQLAVLDHRTAVLARAHEAVRQVGAVPSRSLARELATCTSRRDELAEGPWDCVTGARALADEQRRRRAYAMAAARWESRRRAAEDAAARADTSAPEVAAATAAVVVYLAARLLLSLAGVASAAGASSPASLAAVLAAGAAGTRVYLVRCRARAVEVSRARDELRQARHRAAVCTRAAAGGTPPRDDVLNDGERAVLRGTAPPAG